MRRVMMCAIAGACALAVLIPSKASAQGDRASIVGLVQDAFGAVLPGVTVEASSPALIEKVRTAVTDGAGRYAVENLRPGAYTVTFALPGFTSVKREGIVLEGTFAAQVNASLTQARALRLSRRKPRPRRHHARGPIAGEGGCR